MYITGSSINGQIFSKQSMKIFCHESIIMLNLTIYLVADFTYATWGCSFRSAVKFWTDATKFESSGCSALGKAGV